MRFRPTDLKKPSGSTDSRIAQYELAFRMQTSVPEVMDLKREPSRVLEAYGSPKRLARIELRQQLLVGAPG